MSAPTLAPTGTAVHRRGRWGCLLAVGLPTGHGITVVSRTARELQVLLGVAPLRPSDGVSSHAQERLLGSSSTSMVSSTWRPTLSSYATSPESLCLGVWDGAWCLLTSPAQRRGLSPPEPLLTWGLIPRRDLVWLAGAGSR